MPRGLSHIGLSTLNLENTKDFYENVLRFKPVRFDEIKVKEVGNEGIRDLRRKRRVQWVIVLRK